MYIHQLKTSICIYLLGILAIHPQTFALQVDMESLRMERSKKRSAKSKRCRRVGPRWGDLSLMNGAPPYQIKVIKRFCNTYISMNIDW